MRVQRRDIYGAVDMIADERPDAFNSIEDVYIAATSRASAYWNPKGYENKLVCRAEMGWDLPPVPYSIQQQIDASRDEYQKTLGKRTRHAEQEKSRRHRKAAKEGRKVRAYRRR